MPRTRKPWAHPSFAGAAAQAGIERPLSVLHQKILEHLAQRAETGATQEELEQAFADQHQPQSVQTRMRELYDAGKVRAAGFTRPTASGSPARVWLAV